MRITISKEGLQMNKGTSTSASNSDTNSALVIFTLMALSLYDEDKNGKQ